MGDGFKLLSLSNGFWPQGAPHFCGRERTYAKLGRFPPHVRSLPPPSVRPIGLVRFRVHPLSVSIFQTDTLFRSYSFEQTCLFVETLRGIYILPLFPKIFLTKFSLHFTSSSLLFVRLFCKQLSSSESSDYVPLRRNEIRSIPGDNCPLSPGTD